MTPKEIASTFFDHSIRTEQIIALAFQADQYPDNLKELWEEELQPQDEGCETVTLQQYAALNKLFSEGAGREVDFNDTLTDADVDEFMQELYRENLLGFLVQASTPVPTAFHKGDGHSTHGFGWCTHKWFYTEALDGAFAERLVKWQTDYIEEKRAKAVEAGEVE
jgi:hypothetical protein